MNEKKEKNKEIDLNKTGHKKSKIFSMLDYNGKLDNLKKLKKDGKMTDIEFKHATRKLWLKTFFGTIGFVILISALIFGSIIIKQEIDKKIEKSKEVQVPNVVGKTISEAEQELSKSNLSIRAEDTNLTTLYSGDPEAIIVEQQDKEGTILKKEMLLE